MSHDIKEELKEFVPQEKLIHVKKSYDIIGSKQKAVAIVEIPNKLSKYEEMIANAIMKVNKNVKTVLVKETARRGEYRIRDLRIIAGDLNTEVMHKESGLYFRLDPRKVYFSPRESSEREKLSALVRTKEEILVMFSGIGPIPIHIARNKKARITAVEINPIAHNYCIENIHLNKVEDKIEAIQGDVREVCPKLVNLFDRIIMPLPKGAHEFLDLAIPLLKDPGFIHLYQWASQERLYSMSEELIARWAQIYGKKFDIIGKKKVSQYSPKIWKIRIDVLFQNSIRFI
jgi:tRNA (guanine37-N1)-methyltransferase